ncbi:MAG: sigma-70 family RNA polymerase sigma factor [Planctomycetia bacterium]|nr:sigma-70 family RNA polymerase sigma factor [Planctomycetia bacterium]
MDYPDETFLPKLSGGGMTTAKLSDTITRLGQRLPGVRASAATDPELLARFLADRNEEAFAQIVRRHGAVVFGVCRRVTGNYHLAEDAFQAVFVVLAAKAASVRPRNALSAWLYGVAYRTALRARTMSDRRRRRETLVEKLPESAQAETDSVEGADIAGLLDEEIARLPEHQRLPVVLCELEGRSRQEGAEQLGIPEGTLSSRLAAARKALAERLRQRGVVLSVVGLTAAFGQLAEASVPPNLTARAVAVAITPGVVPAHVADLSHGVLRVMFFQKLKAVTLVLGLIAIAVLTGGMLLARDREPTVNTPSAPTANFLPVGFGDAPNPVQPTAKFADPKPQKGSNKLLFWRNGDLVLIDPDGKNEKKISKGGIRYHSSGALLSPDGKQLAVLIPAQILPPLKVGEEPRKPERKLHVRGLDEKKPGTDLGVQCQMYYWSPDGTEIACSEFEDGRDKPPDAKHFLVNVKTKKQTDLKLPADHIITDWSRDGKFFVTTRVVPDKEKPQARIFLMNRDGTEHKALTDEKQIALLGRLSPDGKQVLFHILTLPPKEKPGQPRRELATVDVATGKLTKVEDVPLNAEIQASCWSPDSKKIAYTWRQVHEGKPEDVIDKATESHLVICDPDGKNQKTLVTEKGRGQWVITLASVDWGFVADDPKEDAKTDEEKLQGKWKVVSVQDGGREVEIEDATVTFVKDKMILKDGNRKLEGPFKLDSTKKPKWIDATMSERKTLGIYELDGDNLKICINEDPNGERPTKFVSEGGTPNDVLMILKREKP